MSEAAIKMLGPEEALQMQTAEFVAWERRRRADAEKFYEKYEELKARHGETGTDWGRRFEPIEKAGYDVWRSRESGGDIPLMPLIDGGSSA